MFKQNTNDNICSEDEMKKNKIYIRRRKYKISVQTANDLYAVNKLRLNET